MLTRWTWAVLVLSPGCQLVFGVDPSGRDASTRLDGPNPAQDGGDVVDAAADAGPTAACQANSQYVSFGGAAFPRYASKGTASSFEVAKAMCATDGAHPVSVTERGAEWARLAAQTPGATTQWIGLERSGGITTAVDGDAVVEADLPWNVNEPSTEPCVVRTGIAATAALRTSACTSVTAEVLCECPEPVTCAPSTPQETTVGPTGMNHVEAKAYCTMMAQRLWRPASGAELLAVRAQYATTQSFLWVDATDAGAEGRWRATDGCFPYLRWGVTTSNVLEPDGDTNENCAALFLNATNEDLVDVPCTDAYLSPLCQPVP